MRHTQAEKMELIRLVEDSAVSIRRTLDEFGICRSTFYRWYGRYLEYGYDGLADHKPSPRKFWNKIPQTVKDQVVKIALERPEQSSRELAWHITDTYGYYISESSVYRILKSHDLITSPAYILISAADHFQNPTESMSYGRPTSHTSGSLIGAGIICPP